MLSACQSSVCSGMPLLSQDIRRKQICFGVCCETQRSELITWGCQRHFSFLPYSSQVSVWDLKFVEDRNSRNGQLYKYVGVLIGPQPDLLPYIVGRNRLCRWKEGPVHVRNCKSFLVTEAERKHVRRRARFQQHRDASCHQVFFSARQGAEGNSRHSDRNIRRSCTIIFHRQKLGGPV